MPVVKFLKLLSFAAVLLLTGCAVTTRYRVAKFAPITPEDNRLAEALETVYVVVEEPVHAKPKSEGMLGRLIRKSVEAAQERVPAEDIARETAARLRASGAFAASYRVRAPGESDPWPAKLGAASVLSLKTARVEVTSAKKVYEPEKRDEKGKLIPEKATWTMNARWRVDAELSDRASGRRLKAFAVSASAAGKVTTPEALKTWVQEKTPDLVSDAATGIAVRLLVPHTVYEVAAATEVPRSGADWFRPRTAVLPFADETTSIDGPMALRKLTNAELAEAGYNVIPVDEVDETLRLKGFTLGGQLKATTPEKIASWLGADRLLFGDIDHYKKLPAPMVGGTLTIWDAKTKKNLYTLEANAVVEKSLPGAYAAVRKASGLSWSAAMIMPTAETLRFVRRALSELPQQAPVSK